ncbi:putative nucleic acid-binding protein [Bacillus tianshenii]|uniref:Nucleic acid-binding protein n=1 Tax=Sutcliffiella tianshenii TaxID=1463404 RepID=A0ABS2NZI7_9BACI|nr:PIN domain-containing protein [Bacillus tianshenii]MBM7620034.1 putative nucleic acid-binding protein [Bacillus tianshenii]
MDVFLDSNVSYTDPFMKEVIFNRLLLELSEHEHINLFVSEVVRDEMINNFRQQLVKQYETIKTSEKKIVKLLHHKEDKPIEYNRTVEDYVEQLDRYLQELEDYQVIEVVPYPHDLLPELVKRSISRSKPFSDNKQEFRDAIIWLSYVEFAKKHNLEKCYLITANSNDFLQNGKLHPDLAKDSTAFTVFKDAQTFINQSEEVKKLQKTLEVEKWADAKQITKNPGQILELIEKQQFETVYDACDSFFTNHGDSMSVKFDTYDTVWLELYGIEFKEINNVEVEVVLDHVIVTGYLTVEAMFEVKDRNPMYEPGDEEYFELGSDEKTLSINFSLTIDQDMEIEDLDINEIEVD